MTLSGILGSPSQRRSFLLASTAVLVLCVVASLGVSAFAPSTPVWNTLNSFFISVVGSGVYALAAGLYLIFFFVDPNDVAAETVLLPQDIGQALHAIASTAADYKFFCTDGAAFPSGNPADFD
jgi:hypothetical protein